MACAGLGTTSVLASLWARSTRFVRPYRVAVARGRPARTIHETLICMWLFRVVGFAESRHDCPKGTCTFPVSSYCVVYTFDGSEFVSSPRERNPLRCARSAADCCGATKVPLRLASNSTELAVTIPWSSLNQARTHSVALVVTAHASSGAESCANARLRLADRDDRHQLA
jgi:hypothetical protein